MARWPCYDDEQIDDVVAVLKSGRVNAWTGDRVRAFEQAYASFLGRRHAIATSNGTTALDIALHALDLHPGDEVIVTPRSFVASASCVAMAGLVPVFADIDPDSQALDPASVAAHLTPRTRAIIVVHLGGWPAEMHAIMRLARNHSIAVIEDCAQAHGAEIAGRPVGCFGDIATYSFCQDKIISTGGEGGLVAMDDDRLWARAWSRKDHGKDPARALSPSDTSGFRWLHDSFGSNYRMLEIQAAIGLRQMERLPAWHAARAANAAILMTACRALPALRTPEPPPNIRHAWYRFYTFVQHDRLRPGWDRDRILAAITRRGVACFTGSCSEIYREKAFVDAGFAPPAALPIAAELGATSLAFLVDPGQDARSMHATAQALGDVVSQASITDLISPAAGTLPPVHVAPPDGELPWRAQPY